MNAGCYGGETWQYVQEVETVDAHGVLHKRLPADYQVGYREVIGPAEWFVSAQLHFALEDPEKTQARMKTLMQERNAAQPIGLPNCGSVFRNPPGNHAAKLIEAAGLKGYSIGGAQVSPKHANFIINTGEARAADIEQLIAHIREVVHQQSGIWLQTEVKFLGDVA
jgi:UDP-N-acetylmuramate dehydrogenase